jgi:hypothetical protein
MESEPGLYDFDLTRFFHANRYPLRSKTLSSGIRPPKPAASFLLSLAILVPETSILVPWGNSRRTLTGQISLAPNVRCFILNGGNLARHSE